VDRYIARRELIGSGDAVVLSVSGGADSLTLLHVLSELAPRRKWRLHVAHLDHGLRGAEGSADRAFVGDEAARLGLPFVSAHQDIASFARRRRLSLEAAGREIRYCFIEQVARIVGAERVATGHTASDQAETVLLNLIRGAGSDGLAGMAPSRSLSGGPVRLVRPLLCLTRSDTETYCAVNGLRPRQDPTNRSTDFRRNFLRHRILPLLREANPRVEASLARAAHALRLDASALRAQAETFPVERVGLGLEIDLDRLRAVHPAIQVRILRRAIADLGGAAELGETHLEAWLASLAPGFSGEVTLPGRLVWSVEQAVGVLRHGEAASPAVASSPLPADGTWASFGPWLLCAHPAAGRDERAGRLVAHVDRDRLPGPLAVRARQAGDRLRPLGMAAEKRLQDFLVDERVPRGRRDTLPIVTAGDAIVWVAGYRIDERFKVTPGTVSILRLECRRIDGPGPTGTSSAPHPENLGE
jgi:tRNA(Ile)-lysidine synthase